MNKTFIIQRLLNLLIWIFSKWRRGFMEICNETVYKIQTWVWISLNNFNFFIRTNIFFFFQNVARYTIKKSFRESKNHQLKWIKSWICGENSISLTIDLIHYHVSKWWRLYFVTGSDGSAEFRINPIF